MTWLRFTDTVAERPVWEQLGTDAFMLHVAALGYSNRHSADGRLTRSQVRRLLWLDDPLEVAARLVAAGVWETDDDAFVMVDDLADQLDSDEVARMRENNRIRTKRSRLHRQGDHSICDPRYCQHYKAAGQTQVRDTSRDGSRDRNRDVSHHPNPSRPVPSRPVGTRDGKGTEDDDPAPGSAAPDDVPERKRCAHGTPLGIDGGGCEQCPPPLRDDEGGSP